MAYVLLSPNNYLIDFVDGAGFFRFREREFQTIVDAGYIGVSLYIGGAYGVSKECIQAAWNVGLLVSPNYERSPSLALGGAPAGHQAAQTCIQQLLGFGFQGEAHVFVSGVDFSPTAPMFPVMDDFHMAWAEDFLKVDWLGGCYGPRNYMQRLPLFDWWPDRFRIWHWGGDNNGLQNQPVYDFADCKQWYGKKPLAYGPPHNNGPIPAGVDENTLVNRSARFWSGLGYTPPPVPEVDMAMNGLIIDLIDSWVVFEATWVQPTPDGKGGRVVGPIRWIDGATRADRLGAGHDRIERSWRDLHGMVYLGSVLPQGDGHPAAPSVNWDGSQFGDYIIRSSAAAPVLVPHRHESGPAVAG
jgi:hypothetical protein